MCWNCRMNTDLSVMSTSRRRSNQTKDLWIQLFGRHKMKIRLWKMRTLTTTIIVDTCSRGAEGSRRRSPTIHRSIQSSISRTWYARYRLSRKQMKVRLLVVLAGPTRIRKIGTKLKNRILSCVHKIWDPFRSKRNSSTQIIIDNVFCPRIFHSIGPLVCAKG